VSAERTAALCFAVLLAATVAALALAQSVRSRLVVDQVEISNRFDPSAGERARIRFRLTEDEDRATVEVLDRRGATVDTLVAGEPLGDYEIHRLRWDGRGAEPGTYEIRLRLETLGREVVLGEEIDLRRADG
jgi:hypothetical protein